MESVKEFMERADCDEKMARKYLENNGYDIKKALYEYFGGRPPPPKGQKANEWFAGGTASGIAILSRDEGSKENESGKSQDKIQHFAAEKPKSISTDHAVPGGDRVRVKFDFPNKSNIILVVSSSQTVRELKEFVEMHVPSFAADGFNLENKGNMLNDTDTVGSAKLAMAQLKVIPK